MAASADDQIKQFLRFMQSKADVHLQSLETEFDDTKNDHLSEDMYNKSEIVSILDGLRNSIKQSMRQELQKQAKMSVLLLRQVLLEADEQGVEVALDLHRVEDEALHKDLDKIQLSSPSKREEKKPSKLMSIKDEHQRMVQEIDRLTKANEQLADRQQQMQQQATKALQEKSKLQQELESMRGSHKSSEDRTFHLEKEELLRKVNRLEKRLEEVESGGGGAESKEGDKSTVQSKQYQQLKAMLVKKNDHIRELRRRLEKHEPDAVDFVEDDHDGR